MFFLVQTHLGCPGQKATKTKLVVAECVFLQRDAMLCCWSDDMELAFGRAARSGSRCCCLPTLTENVFVSAVFGALSALEALCDYALYKSTFYLLTYYANAVYAMAVSAHLSVTHRCCTKKTGWTELVFGTETPFHLSRNVLKNLGISENYGISIWNFVTNSRLEKFCHGKSIALPTALVIVLHGWVCWRHYTTIDELWLCTTSQSTITPLTL